MSPFVFTQSFFLWTALGIIGGIVGSLFWMLIDFLMKLTKQWDLGWEVVLTMGLAGLLIGLAVHFLGSPGQLEIVVNNIHFNGGKLDTKHNPVTLLTAAIGISAGSSAGPEAPMVQVVGSIGSWMARKFRLKGEAHRSMTIAGMATGFTAMFGAPLGGTLFAMEIMHHKHTIEYYAALIPAFVASGTSFIVFQLITKMGLAPIWKLPFHSTGQRTVGDFFLAMGYGIIAAAVGWLIIWMFRGIKQFWEKIHIPFYLQTLICGVILGVLAWKFPVTRYFSHYEVMSLLHQSWPLILLIVVMLVKILSMTLTVSSGWPGGFIIPLFFIGAALGMVLYRVYPMGPGMGLAVVCCMAAVNSCVTRTPISSIILVCVMTDFSFFMPVLFASLTGFFLAPKSPLIAAQVGMEKELQLNYQKR